MMPTKNITIFAVIDHAAGASQAGLALRPTMVLIFGNPRAGTPLMQSSQTVGLDLPLKILIWEDASGAVWLSYNDPAWLARRHAIEPSQPAVAGMSAVLKELAQQAGQK
jgi:uncharacterized protein (DUF302 family)